MLGRRRSWGAGALAPGITRMSRLLGVLLCLLAMPLHAHAQSSAPKAEREPSRVSVRTPPRIEHLPAQMLPEASRCPTRAGGDGAGRDDGGASLENRARPGAAHPHRSGDRTGALRARLASTTLQPPLRCVCALRCTAVNPSRSSGHAVGGRAGPQDTMRDLIAISSARAPRSIPAACRGAASACGMRAVPGAFGDPFRVLDRCPASCRCLAACRTFYVARRAAGRHDLRHDGLTMPALFHLALGPAVIHATMIGDLQFYAAVPPARYGRRTGGVRGEARSPIRPRHARRASCACST